MSGTNLTGATAVDFGTGHPGTSISGVTATSLTVTSPAGTGTVNVTVTTPNGTSAINAPSDQFTYNAPALPTVTGVSPSSGPTAGGTSVTVSGTNLTGATAVDFGTGHPGTSISGVTATSLTVTSPAGTGTVERHGDHPQRHLGQSTRRVTSSPTTPRRSRRSPGVSPSSGPAAGGTSVTVSGTNLTGATAVDFGTANPGTSISGVTATSLTVTSPAGTGTVNVTVTTPNGTSAINAPSDQFTYNAPALPTVTGVSPASGPAAGGTSVTVSRHQLDRRHRRRLRHHHPGTSISGVTATSLTVTSPAGTGTVERHGDHPQRHLGRQRCRVTSSPTTPRRSRRSPGSAPRTDQRPAGPRSR